MTSLLAFAWRKANNIPQSNTTSTSSNFRNSVKDPSDDLLQQGISESSSGDSICCQPSTDTLFEKSTYTSRSHSRALVDAFHTTTTSTPEALRGRKSTQEIRKELGLPPKRLQFPPQPPRDDVDRSATPLNSCGVPTAGCSLFPQAFHCGDGMPASPQVSTSSLYSRASRSSRHVAQSPNLVVGQAKTAVGALVAMTEMHAQKPPPALQNSSHNHRHYHHHQTNTLSSVPNPNDSAILPSRDWLQDHRSVDEAQDISIEMPYESLNDSKLAAGAVSPLSKPPYFHDTMSDEESSIHASPSSCNNRRNHSLARHLLPDTSFTRGFLEAEDSYISNADRYDFNPIVVDHDEMNVSATGPPRRHPMSSPESIKSNGMSRPESQDIESMQSMEGDRQEMAAALTMHHPMETWYNQKAQMDEKRFRSQNERKITEDLLLSTMERLQDDADLVMDILQASDDFDVDDLSMRSIVDEHLLLFFGLNKDRRNRLLQKLDKSIAKRSIKVASDAEEQSDLVHALSFTRMLVNASVATSERSNYHVPYKSHRWLPVAGFRAAMGLEEEPQSPETIRGGDTSLFSLPSESGNDATPHTHNLSMTSTITSAITPERNGIRPAQISLRRENLRNTMDRVCTLLFKLSTACRNWTYTKKDDETSSLYLENQIHYLYLDLLTIPNEDLKAVIDSFDLDMMPLMNSITRIVSHDQADTIESVEVEHRDVSLRLSSNGHDQRPTSSSENLVAPTRGLTLETWNTGLIMEGEPWNEAQTLFSPNTQDMQSIERSTVTPPAPDLEDDLRRTVGSFDRNDMDMEPDDMGRESPPSPITHSNPRNEPNFNRGRKSKSMRGIFQRRRYKNRQAAE